MEQVHSVVIASPHALEAGGVGAVLTSAGWSVLGQPTTVDGLLEILQEAEPEIIILDGCLAGEHADLVRDLSNCGQAVVLLEGPERPGAMILDGLLAGARGCLCVDEPPEEFIASLKLAVHGSAVVYRRATEMVVDEIISAIRTRGISRLTAQQRRIVSLVARGASNKEIAEQLGISEHTVKVHLSNMLGKLGLDNRQQLAVYAVHHGLVEPNG